MSSPLSIIGSWLTLFASTLESYGIDSHHFLRERGIDYSQQSDPSQRIALSVMSQLWEDALITTNDPYIGLKAGQFVTPTTFSALGIALWSSCSLHDLLLCWSRYLHVFSTAADIQLSEDGDELVMTCGLNTNPEKGEAHLCAIDATISALLHLCRQYYGQNITPLATHLTRPKPSDITPFEELFGQNLTFDQPKIVVRFDRQQADEPIAGGNPALAEATEQLVAQYLYKLQSPSFLNQVQQVLFERWPRGEAKLDIVASKLHVSPRTLHRKLEEAGTNFRQQQEVTRHQLALKFINQPHLSISEIGFLLGFSSNSNFSRAFKRWTQQTPQAYRQQLEEK